MTNSNHFTVPKHVLYQIICTSEDITNDLVFQEKGHSYNMSFRCTIFCPTRVNIVSCIFPLVLPRPIKLSSLAPHSSANTSARWPSAPVFPPPAGVVVTGWWWFSRTAVKMSVFHQLKHHLPFESLTKNISDVTTREPADLICDRAKTHHSSHKQKKKAISNFWRTGDRGRGVTLQRQRLKSPSSTSTSSTTPTRPITTSAPRRWSSSSTPTRPIRTSAIEGGLTVGASRGGWEGTKLLAVMYSWKIFRTSNILNCQSYHRVIEHI